MMKSFFYRCIIIIACFLFCCPGDASAKTVRESPGQIWSVGSRRWNEAAEQRFAAWLEKTVTEDFFLKHNIPIDCADVPYALRWIYARIEHLPAAATLVDGRLYGHWSTDLAHLPTHREWFRDRRFRSALSRMLSGTSTKTLPQDTYPIRITPDSLLAGTVSVVSDSHAGIVGSIVPDGSEYSPIRTWEVSLPRKVKKLNQRSYFSSRPDSAVGTGLVRFCCPVLSGAGWGYLPREKHPFYSLEQYRPDFCMSGELFDEAVARRIAPLAYDPLEKIVRISAAIRRYLEERVPLVLQGYQRCKRSDCSEGSPLWEAYSTPGRDDMIAFQVKHLQKVISSSGLDQDAVNRMLEDVVIPIDQQRSVSLSHIAQNYLWLSHDPGDSIEARWGLDLCRMISNQITSTFQDLDFVEQRYRAADPEYADSVRSRHLAKLKWLEGEGRRVDCRNLPQLP